MILDPLYQFVVGGVLGFHPDEIIDQF